MAHRENNDEYLLHVLDTDKYTLASLEALLTMAGYQIECFNSAKDLLNKHYETLPACIITEWNLSDITGLELLEKIRVLSPAPAVVILTTDNELREAVKAMLAGASDFVTKPYIGRIFVKKIKAAIEENSSKRH